MATLTPSVNVQVLDHPTIATTLSSMTYWGYRSRLARVEDPNIVAVVAMNDSPVGLALAEIQGSQTATFLSLYVKPNQRHQGLGRQLVQAIQRELAVRGVKQVSTTFADRKRPEEDHFVAILRHEGWSSPEPLRIQVRGPREALRACTRSDQEPHRLPQGWSIVSWNSLTIDQIDRLKTRQGKSDSHNPWRLPLRNLNTLVSDISVALLVEDQASGVAEIRGWMTCHQVDESTLRYSDLFVDPSLGRAGAFIWLLDQSYRRHLDKPDGLTFFESSYLVDCPVARWLNRRFESNEDTEFFACTYRSEKQLVIS